MKAAAEFIVMTTETDVDIVCYSTSTPGFNAVIKHRYRDFQVFEISEEGELARLTSLAPPRQSTQESSVRFVRLEDISSIVDEFSATAGQSNAQKLRWFLERITEERQTGSPSDESIELDPIPNKEQRTAIHKFLKSYQGLPPLLTDTIQPVKRGKTTIGELAPATRIRISWKNPVLGGSGNAAGLKRRQDTNGGGAQFKEARQWPGGSRCRHLRFSLYKENMDTAAAIAKLAHCLHVRQSCFGFAGTKDKRGVTVQHVTAFKISAERLAGLNPKLYNMQTGNYKYVERELCLGALRGNAFRLVLRGVDADKQQVEEACRQLQEKGFVNYFGLQRFGTGGVATHEIGRLLLQGKWQDAVRAIMRGRDDERPEWRAARDAYLDKGDIQAALRALPQFMVAERSLLEALKRRGSRDAVGALLAMPRGMRSMYLHAYQSLLWNRAASHRLTTYGADAAVEGDLVLPGGGPMGAGGKGRAAELGNDLDGDAVLDEEALVEAATGRGEGDDGETAQGETAQGNGQGGGCLAQSSARRTAVRLVTAADVVAGTYSIHDVVLPLLGGSTLLPGHTTAEVYRRAAAADGLDIGGGLDMGGGGAVPVHHVPQFSLPELPGDYRRLLQRPTELTWRVEELPPEACPDKEDALSPTDLDLLLLHGQRGADTAGRGTRATGAAQAANHPVVPLGQFGQASPCRLPQPARHCRATNSSTSLEGHTCASLRSMEATLSSSNGGDGYGRSSGDAGAAALDKGLRHGAMLMPELGGNDSIISMDDLLADSVYGDDVEAGEGSMCVNVLQRIGDSSQTAARVVDAPTRGKGGASTPLCHTGQPIVDEAGSNLRHEVVPQSAIKQGVLVHDRPRRVLVLDFKLPSSSYATMVVRELTKESTSKQHHKGWSQDRGQRL